MVKGQSRLSVRAALLLLVWCVLGLAAQGQALLGDLDKDGAPTVRDLSRLRSHISGGVTLPPELQPLADLTQDGVLDERDAALLVEAILGRRTLPLALTRIHSSSPTAGETGVAVTRETIIRFTAPLAVNAANSANVHAEFGGQALPARVQLSTDRRAVTLFYTSGGQILPASSRIRVTVDGDALLDSFGNKVDADGDGQAGGKGVFEFETLSLTVVQGTRVCGRVFASELARTPTGTQSVNQPLAGVTITVDGKEGEIFTVTDERGDFRLENCPGAPFFVHVNGLTAVLPPGTPPGAYYPNVGKQWVPVPGEEINVGEIYLPLVEDEVLQPVSVTQDTTIRLDPDVINEFPEFADVRITVPAGSLRNDDGTPGGKVGISLVPPDRLPGQLPASLPFPMVITVQTDGAANFDSPAPICFPNLPDKDGNILKPGEKTSLFSFNHDTGRFEIVGSMTVSADGKLICSDPGSGILAPGWHAAPPRPFADAGGGPMDRDPGDPDPNPPKDDPSAPPDPEKDKCKEKPSEEDPYADPIRYYSGEFYEKVVDLRIKGRGMDFVWERTYRSRDGISSVQGNNWDFSYNVFVDMQQPPAPSKSPRKRLRIITKTFGGSGTASGGSSGTLIAFPKELMVCNGAARKDFMVPIVPGLSWTRPSSRQLIQKLTDGRFTSTFPSRGRWNFNRLPETPTDPVPAPGRISSSVDRNGNTIQFFYDGQNRLQRIRDTLDRDILIGYNAEGFIETITDFTGRVIRYAYYRAGDAGGSPGDLKSVTYPAVTGTPNGNDFPNGKTITYTYSKGFADDRLNHNLLTITDGRRNDPADPTFGQGPYLTNVYAATTDPNDPNFDRIVRQVWGGGTIDLHYTKLSPSELNRDAVMQTIVNDRVGNVIELVYDDRNRLLNKKEFTGRADPATPTTPTTNRPSGRVRADDPPFYETQYFWTDDDLPAMTIFPRGNSEQFIYEADINPNAPTRARANVRYKIHSKSSPTDRLFWKKCNLLGFRDPGSAQGADILVEYFEYDDAFSGCCGPNFVRLHRDPNGNITQHRYDGNGNRTQTTHRIARIVEDFGYNGFGQLTSHTHPDNGSGFRRRDEFTYYLGGAQRGYLENEIVDVGGLNLTTTHEYNSVGVVTRITDPRRNATDFVVNSLDQVVREFSRPFRTGSAVRYQRDYFYDANNNRFRTDIQNVNADGLAEANSHFMTTTSFDILNYPLTVTREVEAGRSIVTRSEYDLNRNVTAFFDGEAMAGRQPTNTVHTQYDERNLKYREIRGQGGADQSTTQFDYDGNGNLAKVTSGLEHATPHVAHMTFDLFDRLETTTDPMGNVTRQGYDNNGNVVFTQVQGALRDTDSGSAGNVLLSHTDIFYDAMDRRERIEAAFFDAATQTAIGDGKSITRFTYTDLSQPETITNDNNHTVTYRYDRANRRLSATDAKSNSTTFGYDANSNVTSVTEVDKSDLGKPDETFVSAIGYDPLDRKIRTEDNAGNINEFFYDSRGNLTRTLDALRVNPTAPGNKTQHRYDGLNRLVQTVRFLTADGTGSGAPTGTITTAQGWDDSSRLVSQTDDNGNVTIYGYDPLNRRTSISYADGTAESVSYNQHGNAVGRSDANQNSVVCRYDLNDRLIRCDITPGPGVSNDTTFEAYEHDGLNRLILAQDDDSTVARAYDSLSNVVAETQNGKTVACAFDGVGNMVGCRYPGGRQITCGFDALERKVTVSDTAGQIARFDFFGPRRVERKSYANGTRCDYGFDAVRRINTTVHSRANGTDVFDSRSYGWDRMFNKTAHLEAGGVQRAYGYDSAYRMTSSSRSDTGNIGYQFDGVQNRVTVTGGPEAGNYTLNATLPAPADRQVNQYTATPFDARAYDLNGNLTAVTAAGNSKAHSYDYRNRFTAYSDPASGTTAQFKYDAFNRRIETRVNGTVTRFFYDAWQVVEEQSDASVTLATYTYGHYIDEPLQMFRGGQGVFYHADDLYNVRKLTNAAGQVVESYDFGDYGKPVAASTLGNPYLFTGQRYDSATGLYYYRTRYLDSAAGVFTSRDLINAWGDAANYGNAKSYVAQSPNSFVDPLGLTKECSIEIFAGHGSASQPHFQNPIMPGNAVGQITCFGNRHNDFYNKNGVGIPGLPRYKEGPDQLLTLSVFDVNEYLLQAWNAAITEARRKCSSRSSGDGCCDSIRVTLNCDSDMLDLSTGKFLPSAFFNSVCGRSQTVMCR